MTPEDGKKRVEELIELLKEDFDTFIYLKHIKSRKHTTLGFGCPACALDGIDRLKERSPLAYEHNGEYLH